MCVFYGPANTPIHRRHTVRIASSTVCIWKNCLLGCPQYSCVLCAIIVGQHIVAIGIRRYPKHWLHIIYVLIIEGEARVFLTFATTTTIGLVWTRVESKTRIDHGAVNSFIELFHVKVHNHSAFCVLGWWLNVELYAVKYWPGHL